MTIEQLLNTKEKSPVFSFDPIFINNYNFILNKPVTQKDVGNTRVNISLCDVDRTGLVDERSSTFKYNIMSGNEINLHLTEKEALNFGLKMLSNEICTETNSFNSKISTITYKPKKLKEKIEVINEL